jgi:D-alanyl-D-alanine carboxypeptidase
LGRVQTRLVHPAHLVAVLQEIARLQAKIAVYKTAKVAYIKALKAALPIVGGSDTIKLN